MTEHTTTSAAPSPELASTRMSAGPVLVAVGGQHASAALGAAHALGLHFHSDIVAITLLESLPAGAMELELRDVPAEYQSAERDALLDRLSAQVGQVFGQAHRVSMRVVYGTPRHDIADVARQLGASLIVMGIGRHRPLDRVFGSETTLHTIRRAPCPVLALSSELTGPPTGVVVATDFSAACAEATRRAIPLLAKDAVLHLVHAWQRNHLGTSRARELDAAYLASLDARFDELLRLVEVPDGMTVSREIREGFPADCVLDAAREHAAELVIAGQQGESLLERFRVGSVTTGLVRRTPCSLYVAPAAPT